MEFVKALLKNHKVLSVIVAMIVAALGLVFGVSKEAIKASYCDLEKPAIQAPVEIK